MKSFIKGTSLSPTPYPPKNGFQIVRPHLKKEKENNKTKQILLYVDETVFLQARPFFIANDEKKEFNGVPWNSLPLTFRKIFKDPRDSLMPENEALIDGTFKDMVNKVIGVGIGQPVLSLSLSLSCSPERGVMVLAGPYETSKKKTPLAPMCPTYLCKT